MIGKERISSKQEIIATYERHYSQPGQLRESDAFYRWVLRKLTPVPGRYLLDIACGEGHLGRIAAKWGLIATSLDFSPSAAAIAYENTNQDKVVIADGHTLPFASNTFDYLTNLGSLEHFVSPRQGLVEMRRVIRRDGTAALLLPNSYYLLDIFWHVLRLGYPVSHRQSIERFATAGEWRDLVEENGFEVTKAYKYNMCWPQSLSDLKWYLRFPKKIPYMLLGPLTPFNLSYSFLFICSVSP
jgi:ubiquinone/menaquinone biosynthesis C-methylase UbiE